MVRRSGIGATSASAVIFSIILLSNFAVYFASQSREKSYFQSDVENAFVDSAVALTGAGAADILMGVQSFLASRTFDCRDAVAQVSSWVNGTSASQKDGGITVDEWVQVAGAGPPQDNLTMLAPYNGFSQGGLDLALKTEAFGSDPGAGVSYAKNESHIVHLPVRLWAEAADCLQGVRYISEEIASENAANCTSSEVAPLMQAASQIPAGEASRDNFTFGLTYDFAYSGQCVVQFDVSLTQGGILGPGGTFSVAVQEAGSAAFE